jgi:hypothetical protein
MRILDQLDRQVRRSAGVVQEAADAHQVAAKAMRETAETATVAFAAVAAVAVLALVIATYVLVTR